MSWIKTVSYEDSEGRLRKLYDRVKGPDNNIDNIVNSIIKYMKISAITTLTHTYDEKIKKIEEFTFYIMIIT